MGSWKNYDNDTSATWSISMLKCYCTESCRPIRVPK